MVDICTSSLNVLIAAWHLSRSHHICVTLVLQRGYRKGTVLEIQTYSVRITTQRKGKFLYSIVSSPQHCSKCFALYFLADLLNQTPSQLLWENTAYTCICTLPKCVQVFIRETKVTSAYAHGKRSLSVKKKKQSAMELLMLKMNTPK